MKKLPFDNSLSVRMLAPWCEALRDRGVDVEAMWRAEGHAPGVLSDPEQRIDVRSARVLWQLVEAQSAQEPGMIIDVARRLSLSHLGVLGFAWMASTTLREAFTRLTRFYAMLSSIGSLVLSEEQGLLYVQSRPHPGATTLAHESWAITLLAKCRMVAGNTFVPARVQIAQPASCRAAALEAFIGCPIEYGADSTALAISQEQADQMLPGRSPELALTAERLMGDFLSRTQRSDFVATIRRLALDALPSGGLQRAEVARRLHVSERTLQRRLLDEGFTFAGLLEEIRADLAKAYLREPRYSVQEVAFMVGFSEIASFTRAFRRWTGVAPSAWRQA